MNKHTISDLYQMQSLPLSAKIRMTENRIRGWYDNFDGDVYVSFSGGKDSTVLVDIITKMGYTDIPLVFIDTGLEYPEIREFVKSYGDRVTWVKPKMTFKEAIEKYGYPFISKEVAECVWGARRYLTKLIDEQNALTDRQTDRQTDACRTTTSTKNFADAESMKNPSRGGEIASIVNYEELANLLNDRMLNRKGGQNQRLAIMLGMLTNDPKHPVQANIPNGNKSMFSQQKYKFFLDADFEIGNRCCNVMKKEPAHRYAKETGRKPITAQMASESRLRTQKWLMNGCNAFDATYPISNPMSFWTEQDVLLYIKQYNLPICPIYGDIVEDLTDTEEVEGQLTMSDIEGWEDQGLFDADRLPLKTTGRDRTGCMFCGFGCHLEKGEGRFVQMKKSHPKQYDYIMRPWGEGGLNYKEIIDWINEHGNLNIRY